MAEFREGECRWVPLTQDFQDALAKLEHAQQRLANLEDYLREVRNELFQARLVLKALVAAAPKEAP